MQSVSKAILLLLFKHPEGLTREEIESDLGLKCSSSSPRVHELKMEGYLAWKTIDDNLPSRYERRKTMSGATAHVLILTATFRAALRGGKNIDIVVQEFSVRPRSDIEKEDRIRIIEEFQTFIERWRPYHTEIFVWNVLRQLYDPVYREDRVKTLTSKGRRRIWNRLEKVTI